MLPILPHLASECLKESGYNKELIWPEAQKKYLKEKKLNIVVQINGKKRSVITTENNLNEEDLVKIINETQELKKFLIDKEIVRNIFIKDKLINLIIK